MQPACVVFPQPVGNVFEGVDRQLSDSHIVEVVDDDPALDLAVEEHIGDDFLLGEDCGQQCSLDVAVIDEPRVADYDWPEKVVPATGIQKPFILL